MTTIHEDHDEDALEFAPAGEAMLLAELWRRRAAGVSYADLATGIGITERNVGAMFAVLGGMLADDLEACGLPVDPPAELRAAVALLDADLTARVLAERMAGLDFDDLDRVMGGAKGTAGVIVALILESILSDLRAHGFETDPTKALAAAYAAANGIPEPAPTMN